MKKLDFIRAHNHIFGCKQLYGLDIFEQLVDTLEKQSDEDNLLEVSCKIEQDRLYAVRFFIKFNANRAVELELIRNFFDRVSARVEVNLDYTLVNQFFSPNFDYRKSHSFLIGIDLRRKLTDSSIELALTIKDYPEKQKLAVTLSGEDLNEDLRMLLVNNFLHIGFDFGFNGKSNIELYPYISKQEWQRIDVKQRLMQVLSPVALQPLPICSRICVGLSKANSARKIYYYLERINDFLSYFPANDIARRVHAYYQQQPVKEMAVALLESELQAKTIQQMNLYYIL